MRDRESGKVISSSLLSADAGSTEVRSVSLSLDSRDHPVVSWIQSGKTYVRRWNGSVWISLGAALHSGQQVQATFFSAMGIDAAGNPVVASTGVMSGDASTHLFVQRWDGESWVSLGGALSAMPGSTSVQHNFAQELDQDGHPVLAWSEFDGSANNIHVYAYNH